MLPSRPRPADSASSVAATRRGSTTVAGTDVTPYRWVIAGALVSSNWAMTIGSLSFGLLLPAISESMGLSDLQGGWLSSAMRVGNVLMAIPAAIFLSRFNPLRVSTISILLGSAFLFMLGVSPTFAVLLLARLGLGLSFTMRAPGRTMLVQQWFALKEIPFVNGLTSGLSGIAEALTLTLTPTVLAVTGSWRATCYVFGAVSMLSFLVWTVCGREHSTPAFDAKRFEKPSIRALFKYADLWLVGMGCAGTGAGWFAFITFWPTHMLNAHDFSLTTSGVVLSLMSLSQIPAAIGVGLLAARVGHPRLILAVCGLLMAAGLAGMMLTTNFWALMALSSLGGLGWAFVPVALSLPYQVPGIEPREVAVGSTMITTWLVGGGVLGPVLAGAISDQSGSLYLALIVCAMMPLTLAGFSTIMKSKRTT